MSIAASGYNEINPNNGWGSLLKGAYFSSIIIILTLTAIAKIHLLIKGGEQLEAHMESVAFLRIKHLVMLASALEVLLAVCLIKLKLKLIQKALLTAWLALLFLLYRLHLWWVLGIDTPCDCLGTLTQALGIRPSDADYVSQWLLAYMLLGSVLIIIDEKRKHKTK